jgi:uncharacterized protein
MMKESFAMINSMKKILSILLLCWLCLGFAAPAQATGAYDLPALSAGENTWLVDQAEVLSLATESKLNAELKELAQKSGKELRLVVIRRLDYGATLSSLAEELFSLWYPTPEAQENQVLLVLDTLTNNSAIRQGKETEGLLTEAIAASVITETLKAPLKEGAKYNQALLDASKRLEAVLAGKADPGPPEAVALNIESTFASAEETDDRSATLWVIVLLVLATAIPMVTYFWYAGLPGK